MIKNFGLNVNLVEEKSRRDNAPVTNRKKKFLKFLFICLNPSCNFKGKKDLLEYHRCPNCRNRVNKLRIVE